MKKYLNSEGYTLITVLLIIVIISMFALTLIPKALSTAVQVNKGEEMSQTKDLAEMGVSYTHALLQNKVQLAINDVKNDPNFTKENHNTLFCKKIKPRLNEVNFLSTNPTLETIAMTDSNFKYTIEGTSGIFINANNAITCEGFESITIPISSTGKVVNKGVKEVQAEFSIKNGGQNLVSNPGNGGSQTGPINPDTLALVDITTGINVNNEREMYSSPRFHRDVDIVGNGMLSIGGHAWFREKLYFRGNNSKLLVTGDAYFNSKPDKRGQGNNYICVKGTSYERLNNRWVELDLVSIGLDCPPNIWEEVKDDFFYDINDWMIMDIDVTY